MAKFVYQGDLDENVMGTRAFGLAFPVGVAVEAVDANAVAKLSNNPRFVAVSDDVQAVSVTVEPVESIAEDAPIVPRRGRPRMIRNDDNVV